jgi:hypothetical protein
VHASFNKNLDFDEEQSSVKFLSEPVNFLIEYAEEYEKNFMFVKNEEKIEAIKLRFERFEALFEGQEYKRLNKEDFTEEMKLDLIGCLVKIDIEDEIVIEALDVNRNPYRVVARLSEDILDDQDYAVQLFPGQMVYVKGTYYDQELKIEQFIKSKQSALMAQKTPKRLEFRE